MKIKGTDIEMIRGDTEAIRIGVQDAGSLKVDLVDGDVVHFTVKTDPNTEAIILQKIVSEFIEGEALITIYPQDTSGLQFRSYVYDIQLTRANGTVKTIVPVSIFKIRAEVSYE